MAEVTITPTSVSTTVSRLGAELELVQFGESVTPMNALYKSTTDGKYYKATNATQAESQVAGFALNYGSANSYGLIQKSSIINVGGTVAVGKQYVLGTTDGAIEPVDDQATNDWVCFVGYGVTASTLKIDINIGDIQVP